MIWNDAQGICEGEGGNLAIIFDQDTRDVVRGFMSNGHGWIGASDQWREGTWQTPTQKLISYTSWYRGEPNNMDNEDCAYQSSSKTWNDLSCGLHRNFICQFNAGTGAKSVNNLFQVLNICDLYL